MSNMFRNFIKRLDPAWTAFVCGILLSLVAIAGSIAPNPDGMLYIETARIYLEGGADAALALYNWNAISRVFISILIAHVSGLPGIGLEAAGYLLSVLFLAGTCALVVLVTRDRFPEAAWAACAVALAIPALNGYRDYIIREFGAWFLLFLGFWLALKWARRPGWGIALAAQLSICAAALFRPESLVFLLALILWQLVQVTQPGAWKRLLMISSVACGGGLLVGAALLSGAIDLAGTGASPLTRIDLLGRMHTFNETADRLGREILATWSRDEARSILFFGLVSVIPMKFAANLGVFAIPGVFAFTRPGVRAMLGRWAPLNWAFLVYFIVLVLFVLERTYLTTRYVALLGMLAIPLVAVGSNALYARFPRWRGAMLLGVLVLALANVISTSPKKTHLPQAAAWLRAQPVDRARVFVEEAEIAYLAGWSYHQARHRERQELVGRDAVAAALAEGHIDMALLAGSARNEEISAWAAQHGLKVERKFDDGHKRAIFVIRRR